MSDMDIPCSFADCDKVFATYKQLRGHKISEPSHYYCKRCDLDCFDWEDLTQHKVDSMLPFLTRQAPKTAKIMHIVCEFCGEDFKSWGGREIHRRTMHKGKQIVTCRGCREEFDSAYAMIAHIETEKCRHITSDQLKQNIAKKFIISEVMRDPEPFLDTMSRIGPNAVVSAATSYVTTSVPSTRGDEEDNDNGGISLVDDTVDAVCTTPTKNGTKKVEEWPDLYTTSVESMGKLALSEHSASGSVIGSTWKAGNSSKALFPDAQPTPASEEAILANLPPSSMDLGLTNAISGNAEGFDPERFFDKCIGRYVCPFPQCSTLSYYTGKEIYEHFEYGHKKDTYSCPACLKRFKTCAALVGHIERTNTCRIRQAEQLAEVVDMVTGGYLGAVGVKQEKVYLPTSDPTDMLTDGVFTAKFTGELPKPAAAMVKR